MTMPDTMLTRRNKIKKTHLKQALRTGLDIVKQKNDFSLTFEAMLFWRWSWIMDPRSITEIRFPLRILS